MLVFGEHRFCGRPRPRRYDDHSEDEACSRGRRRDGRRLSGVGSGQRGYQALAPLSKAQHARHGCSSSTSSFVDAEVAPLHERSPESGLSQVQLCSTSGSAPEPAAPQVPLALAIQAGPCLARSIGRSASSRTKDQAILSTATAALRQIRLVSPAGAATAPVSPLQTFDSCIAVTARWPVRARSCPFVHCSDA